MVNIVSTTDSAEDVAKAVGMYSKKPVEETKPAPTAKTVGENKAAASEATEVETPDLEADADYDGDDEASVAENTQLDAAGKPKKKGGFQKKIDKLTKARALAEQERDYWRDQHLKNAKATTTEAPKPEAKEIAKADAEPNPDDFTSVPEYMKAVSKWTLAQDKKAAEEAKKVEAARASLEKRQSGFREKVQEQLKVTPDWQDVVKTVDHIQWSPGHLEVITDSDHSPQILYDLAKNPQEYERLSKLPPMAFAREFGRLEAKIGAAAATTTTENKTTKAPKPITPVTRGAATSTKSPDEMDYREYKAWREAGGGR